MSKVISRYTVLVALALLGAVTAVAAVVVTGIGGETFGLWVTDLGSTAVNAAAGVVILSIAARYEPGEHYRRYWTLIGVGVIVYALGDLTWAVYELGAGEVPYPGLPDLFYFAEYAFLSCALVMAALGYRGLVDLRRPLVLATVLSVAAASGLWLVFLGPQVAADQTISSAEKIVSIAYPMADIFAALGPALLLLMVVGRLAGGRLAWPWWAVASGAVMLAASDTAYALAESLGSYAPNAVIEYGWMGAHAMLAVGALVAKDVADSASR